MSTPIRRVSAHAFSLIELLVVVFIIAVLAALSAPGFKRVRSSAMQAECASNLRQISTALFAYAADHDGTLPASGVPNITATWAYEVWTYAGYSSSSYVNNVFDTSLRPGTQGKNIFRCPANAVAFVKAPTVTQDVNGNRNSYGINSGPMGDNGTAWRSPILLARVASPSRTVMVTEDSYCLGSRAGYFYYYGLIPHNTGSNFLFFDGHVEYMPFTEAYKTISDTTFWGS